MRIVLVTSAYAPTVGGLQQVTQELACAWKKSGHEVRVVTNRTSHILRSFEEINSIPVSRHYFVWEMPRLALIPILKFLIQCLLFPSVLFDLWEALNPQKTDLVNLHYAGPPAIWTAFIAKRRNLPLVVTLHGSDLLIEPRRSPLKCWFLKKVLGSANKITTVSNFMLSELESLFPEFRGKGKVIYNGFDRSKFEGIKAKTAHRSFGLCVARLSGQKGQALLLEAFEKINPKSPQLGLIFLGEGASREALMKQVEGSSVRDRISFLGSVSHGETLSLMKGASFVVIPSQAEPFGLVAVEARAFGRPIVAMKRGALPEVLEGYSGVTWVEEETAEDLAQGILRAIDSRPVNPEPMLPFETWNVIAQRYVELFLSCGSRVI